MTLLGSKEVPSTSKKQARFMAAAAHSPAFAKKVGISQDVAKEFNQADKGRKFRSGGVAKKLFGGKESFGEEKKEAQALKSGKISTKQYIAGEKSEGHKEENVAKQARAIKSGKMSPTAYAKSEKEEKYACGGKVKKMADGGPAKPAPQGSGYDSDPFVKLRKRIFGEDKKKAVDDGEGYKRGGSVRGCGIAVKGKTKGRMV